MSPLSVGDFLSHLRRSNVLSAEQWAELQQKGPSAATQAPESAVRNPAAQTTTVDNTSTNDLVNWLLDRGWLTRWQADMLLSGRTTLFLGKYRLLECIGTGGMGAVFKARHAQMERIVALKVMSSAIIRKPRAVARFHKEIQAAAALNHPNIVAAFDADCVGNVHFLVMEFVDGQDLGWYVAQKKTLPIGWVCECIRQAALGLQHAHEQGMVHRDIKPTNLLVTQDPETGRPLTKLLDLGLARFSTETELENDEGSSQSLPGSELTQAGQVLGTPDYMAPEQASNTRGADARCDVFSLGCTLFRLITGEFAFPGESASEKIKARQQGAARRLRSLRPEVPKQLDAVVARMMATDPNQRYQSAREVAEALVPFCRPEELSASQIVAKPSGDGASAHGIQPADAPRLRQLFAHLANQAVDEPKAQPETKPSASRFSRRTHFAILGGIVSLLLIVAGWHWAGETILTVDWPPTDRRQATLKINGREIAVPADREIRTSGRSGRWDLRLTRPGYEPIIKTLDLTFGERRSFSPEWRPLPETVRREELSALKKRAAETAAADPTELTSIALRSDLVRFRTRYAATNEASAATGLLTTLPSSLDRLSRANIPEAALREAGLGDPKQAPAPIVSILGVGRLTCWNRVVSLAVSHDGRWIGVASADGTIRIIDRRDATQRHVLRFSSDPRDIAFSPVDDTLAVAGSRREVTLWNVVDGTLKTTLRGAGDPLAFSPDGKILAAGGRRAEILMFDADTGRNHRTLAGHPGGVPRILLFSPDARRLASQATDGSVALWDVPSESEPRRFPRSLRPRFSPDGSLLATGSGDGDLRIWETSTGELKRTLRRGGDPLGFAPDGQSLVSYRGGRATIWDPATGDERRVLTNVPALAVLSPDGKTLAAANPSSQDMRFWNVQTGTSISIARHQGATASLAFTLDSTGVISAGTDHVIRQWNTATGNEESSGELAWGPVACHPDGQQVAITRQSKIELWDVTKPGQPVRTLEGEVPDLNQLAWSPAGRLIAGCGGARFLKSALRIWESDSGSELESETDQFGAMRLLAFGPSGLRLATLGDSRKVVLWDLAKRTVTQTLDGAPERPIALTLDPGRRLLASAGSGDAVTLWDLQTRVARSVPIPEKSVVRHLAFGPEGHYLVVATTGGILIRDVASGNLLRTLSCKPGAPTWVSLNPAENRLAAVGNTGTVWIWNWRSKALPSEEADEKISIGPSGGLIRQVAWSLDGRHLLTVNGNSTLYVLRLPE